MEYQYGATDLFSLNQPSTLLFDQLSLNIQPPFHQSNPSLLLSQLPLTLRPPVPSPLHLLSPLHLPTRARTLVAPSTACRTSHLPPILSAWPTIIMITTWYPTKTPLLLSYIPRLAQHSYVRTVQCYMRTVQCHIRTVHCYFRTVRCLTPQRRRPSKLLKVLSIPDRVPSPSSRSGNQVRIPSNIPPT